MRQFGYNIFWYTKLTDRSPRLIPLSPGRMSDKVWGAIPTPAVFAKEANPLTAIVGQKIRFFSLEEVMLRKVVYSSSREALSFEATVL